MYVAGNEYFLVPCLKYILSPDAVILRVEVKFPSSKLYVLKKPLLLLTGFLQRQFRHQVGLKQWEYNIFKAHG